MMRSKTFKFFLFLSLANTASFDVRFDPGPGKPVPGGKPVLLSLPKTFRVESMGEVLLPCKIKNLGAMVVVWKFGNRVLTAGNLRIKRDHRIRLVYTDLMLSNLTVEDAGQYTCEVETDIENPLILTHQLDILVPPTIEELNAPGELQVMKGSSITLKCRAKGFPVPKIEWSRSTGSIPLELFSYDRSFLTITNLTRQDGGEYACTAENGVGFPDRHVIRINVKHSPEVIPVTQVVYAGIGEPVELSCTVYASPTGSMTWYHNSLVLDHDNNTFFRSKGSVHTLFISEVKLETLGNYTCLASNVYGRGETTIQLTGIPEPPKYCPELSGEWNNGIYLLAWTCSSATAVIKYRLQYRRFQGKHSVSQEPWFKIEISEESQETSLYSMQYSLEHLSAWVTYEATIEAYNKFGWSYPSQPFNFTPNSGGVSKPAVISTQPKTQSMTSFGTQVNPFAVTIHAILLGILVLNR